MQSKFEDLTLNGIRSLVYILATTEAEDPSYVRRRYEDNAIGFEATVGFLKDLNLLESGDNTISRTASFPILATRVIDNEAYLYKYLIDLFFSSRNPASDAVREYLARFRLNHESLEYRPTTKQRLQDSEIRNLLIEFGIVEHVETDKLYRIADDYIHLFDDRFRNSHQSPLELDFLMKKQQEIGDAAELEVLEYEKNRLSERPDLVNKLRHVSRMDVSAGYDIESYELDSPESTPVSRFIEVKAVSLTGHRFFWSRNEIEKAKQSQGRYYLYLLPVIGFGVFDTANLDIIPDAYHNVFTRPDRWSRQEEKYSVWKAT